MLDENLPAFFLKPSASGIKHHRDIYLSHHGSEPAPAYTLHNADPTSTAPAHKNVYGAALYDAFNPEILYGEVLAQPSWTQPTLSAEELRRNNGITPQPQPLLPNELSIQLYNPDMQVKLEIKEGKWGASERYEFSMPQTSFRTPSASNLDREQSDPASLAITPKVNFAWRRESKLSKELTCFMTGKSTDTIEKKKSKRDPDIAIALWRSMRELTIYEPNLDRMEMEDPKGVEVVLLLSAIVIKDLYFAHKDQMNELFNIAGAVEARNMSASGRRLTNPPPSGALIIANQQQALHSQSNRNDEQRNSLPRLQTAPQQQLPIRPPRSNRPLPTADPRTQWQLDAETARLKAQAEAEAKEQRRRLREREKADEAERKRLQRMVEEEEKAARRKQADIDKETERLRRQYGVPSLTTRPTSHPGQHTQLAPQRVQFAPGGSGHGPFASSSSLMMSGANPSASSSSLNISKPGKKKSFFGLRSVIDDAEERRKVVKKSSSIW